MQKINMLPNKLTSVILSNSKAIKIFVIGLLLILPISILMHAFVKVKYESQALISFDNVGNCQNCLSDAITYLRSPYVTNAVYESIASECPSDFNVTNVSKATAFAISGNLISARVFTDSRDLNTKIIDSYFEQLKKLSVTSLAHNTYPAYVPFPKGNDAWVGPSVAIGSPYYVAHTHVNQFPASISIEKFVIIFYLAYVLFFCISIVVIRDIKGDH